MAERVSGDVQRRRVPNIPAEHSQHDRLLVSRFAADDAYPDEPGQARALVESCFECAALAADIKLLARAGARLPAARRTRDFRLSAEQAEALRGNRLERLLRRLAAPGLSPLRPVAGVALSLGLVMAVVGGALSQMSPASAPAAPFPASQLEAGATPGPDVRHYSAAEDEPGEAPAEPAAEGFANDRAGVAGSEGDDPLDQERIAGDAAALEDEDSAYGLQALESNQAADMTRSLLLYGGLLIALTSLGILLLSWFARRRGDDPLLR